MGMHTNVLSARSIKKRNTDGARRETENEL